MRINVQYACKHCKRQFEGKIVFKHIIRASKIYFIHDICPYCYETDTIPYIPPGEIIETELPFEYYIEIVEIVLGTKHPLSLHLQSLKEVSKDNSPSTGTFRYKSAYQHEREQI